MVNLRSHRGFSLLEVLVSALLFSYIILVTYGIFNLGNLSWKVDVDVVMLRQQVRGAIDGMAREIRQSRVVDIAISNGNANIAFSMGGNNIKYSRNENNQIIREHPTGTMKILASGITYLNFSLINKVVTITVTGAKNALNENLTLTLSEKVYPRN
jgi:prepilin-type N-terminal cleavage/methylation domain-containing protein